MTEEVFRNMVAYQAAMSLARSMLHQGIITDGEYAKIDTTIAGRYGISLFSIFRNNP